MTDQNQDQVSPPRTATRAPVDRPVKLQFDDSLEVVDGHCVNASIGGMLILTDSLRPQGTLTRFELVIDEETSVHGLGEIVWTRPEGSGREAGMGIKFRFLEQGDRQLILRFVSQYIKQRLAQKHPPATDALEEAELSGPTPSGTTQPREGIADFASIAAGDESITLEEPEEEPDFRAEEGAEPSAWDEGDTAEERAVPGDEPAEEVPEGDRYEGYDDEYDEYEDEEEYSHRPAPRREFPLLPVIAFILVAAAALLYVFWDSVFPSSEPPAVAPGVEEGPPEDAGAVDGEPAGTEPIATAADEAPEATTEEALRPPPPEPFPPTPPAETLPPPSVYFARIVDITWVEERPRLRIVITADGTIPAGRYKHLRLEGENPREVIRFTGVRQRYPKSELPVGGPGVRQIRVGYHRRTEGNELHVVLDMLDQNSRVTEILNRGSKLEVMVEP